MILFPKVMLYIPKARTVGLMGHGGCSNFSVKNRAWIWDNLQLGHGQGTQLMAGHTNQPKSVESPT